MVARTWLAHSRADYARLHLARGRDCDADRARELLDAAVSEYRSLGMDAWAGQIAPSNVPAR